MPGTIAAIGWRLIDRFEIGPLSISPHGIGIAVGFLAGGALLARRAERMLGIRREQTWNMLMYAIVGVIIGARLAYVIGHWGDFSGDLTQIPRVWEGGVSLQGGILGGIVAAIPFGRKHGIAMLPLLDAAAPGFPLGIALGRVGDLVIGDHLGTPTSFLLGYKYLGGAQPPDRMLQIGDIVHQTALYDLLIAAAILPIVLRIAKRTMPTGHLISWTAILYATGRIVTDFARTEVATFFGLRGTQWTSITFIVVGVTWLLRPRPRVVPSTLEVAVERSLAGRDEQPQDAPFDEPSS